MLAACSGRPAWRSASGAIWGTAYHITYEAPADLCDSILIVLDSVGESLSMWSPTSTVSRINAGASDSVDAFFAEVFGVSQAVAQASAGRFDPTVAPLVDLWGFGRRGADVAAPDSAMIAEALAKVGILKCSVNNGRIHKANPATEFDFSAVAKGFGVDRVAQMLARNGARNFMVEIGGEIRLAGHNPAGKTWRIQIDAPVEGSAPGDSAFRFLTLTDCAIATSGNYRSFNTHGGHTINPVTGHPAGRQIASATVVAPDCALADAIATALMASPPDSAQAILAPFPGVTALLILPDNTSVQIPE